MAICNTDLLAAHQLRKTPCRVSVLAYFRDATCALAHADLEASLPEYDRVTLYRTLNSFLEKGLIHKVVDDSPVVKYALTRAAVRQAQQGKPTHGTEGSAHKPHIHSHVHFKCEKCQETTCIDEVSVPNVELPQGYHLGSQEVLVLGVCPSCSSN